MKEGTNILVKTWVLASNLRFNVKNIDYKGK